MAWRRPATETLFIGLAQPQSGVGWVGMGLWPVHVGAPTTSRKPHSGVGNGRESSYVPTGLVCGVCARRWTGSVPISSVLHPSLPNLRHYVAGRVRRKMYRLHCAIGLGCLVCGNRYVVYRIGLPPVAARRLGDTTHRVTWKPKRFSSASRSRRAA
jgi:hypothetical protein